VLTVPIASVTTRMPKENDKKGKTNSVDSSTNTLAENSGATTNVCSTNSLAETKSDKKTKTAAKPIEVVFIMDGERAKMVPVKIGISDDNYWEITEGLKEGMEVVSGGYRAISRDLEDGKKIKKGPPPSEKELQADKKE
jgi:HlyD family secretion protein